MEHSQTILGCFFLSGLFSAFNGIAAGPAVCTTPHCQLTSEMLKSSMNTDVDPCTNFYQYACGNFPQYKKSMHKESEDYGWFNEIRNNLTAKVKEFLNIENTVQDSIIVQKTQKFYKECLDQEKQNEAGLEPVLQLLYEIGVGAMGFGKYDYDMNHDWIVSAAKLKRALNVDFLIAPKVVLDPETNITRLSLNIPEVCMPILDDRYTSTKLDSAVFFKTAFKDFAMGISDVMDGIYGRKKKKFEQYVAEDDFAQFAKFSQKRYEWCTSLKGRKELLTIFDLQEKYEVKTNLSVLVDRTEKFLSKGNSKDILDWRRYFTILFRDLEGFNVDIEKLDLLVFSKEALKQMIKILEETPRRILHMAVWFDTVTSVSVYTTQAMKNLEKEFRSEILHSSEYSWADNVCNPLIQKHFGLIYLNRILNDEHVVNNQKMATQMMLDLKLALGEIIRSRTWMDPDTRSAALTKLRAMDYDISHPEWIRNTTLLSMYYEGIDLKYHSFLKTYISFMRSKATRNLKAIGQNFMLELKLDQMDDPLMVNAFYSPKENKMTIPYGIMQRPFFGHSIAAMNYGGLGAVIGHEITHGFDSSGCKYDLKGDLVNWWKNETLVEYKNRTQCFINSYNQITVQVGDAPRNISGKRTLNENIADNGGVHEALIAYRSYVKLKGQEPSLVGFESFSHEQLLTLSFANLWCSATTPSGLSSQLYNVHAPHEARVLGVFKNSKEIANIWKCSVGSPMNPLEEKCEIW